MATSVTFGPMRKLVPAGMYGLAPHFPAIESVLGPGICAGTLCDEVSTFVVYAG